MPFNTSNLAYYSAETLSYSVVRFWVPMELRRSHVVFAIRSYNDAIADRVSGSGGR